MARKAFDPSKVTTQFGKHFYEGQLLGSHRERLYQQWVRSQLGITTNRAIFPKKYSKYFSSGTKFTGRQGHLEPWAKPMSLKGGAKANYNWGRAYFLDSKGVLRKTSSKNLWGSNINQKAPATILNGSKQWIRQIQISLYALGIQAENFRIVAGRRALKVFQNSFKYKQFYNRGAQSWTPLSTFTLKKRASRGTGNRILKEYGDLYNSLKFKENTPPGTTRIFTDVVHANSSHHKKHSICYARYHNEGQGTYGSGWNGRKPKAYIQRQFMGHSSYLDPFTDSFMRKMMKLYLFDSVFLTKKT